MTTPAEATNQEVPAAEQSGDTSTPVAKSQESSDEETEEVTVDASEDVIKRLTTAVEALVEKNTEPTEVEGASEDEVEKAKGKTDEEKAKKAAALTASLKKAGLAEAAIKTALSAAGLGGTTSTQKSADEAPAVDVEENELVLLGCEVLEQVVDDGVDGDRRVDGRHEHEGRREPIDVPVAGPLLDGPRRLVGEAEHLLAAIEREGVVLVGIELRLKVSPSELLEARDAGELPLPFRERRDGRDADGR